MSKKNIAPGDQVGNVLTGVARKPLTSKLTLVGVLGTERNEIIIPSGVFTISLKSNVEINFAESESTYVKDGVTYGTGYPGTNMSFPVWGLSKVYVFGPAGTVVSILFPSIQEV